jgi:hypothetical protein
VPKEGGEGLKKVVVAIQKRGPAWKNGCTTPPFFEACPYTWKCYNFHSSWKLEISFLLNFFPKIRIDLDLHIHCWDFSFMKK